MECFHALLSRGVRQCCLGQTADVLLPEFEELRIPFVHSVGVQCLQHHERVAVSGRNDFNLLVDAIEQVSRACVGRLVSNVNILVLEETRLGIEFGAKLNEGVAALANP